MGTVNFFSTYNIRSGTPLGVIRMPSSLQENKSVKLDKSRKLVGKCNTYVKIGKLVKKYMTYFYFCLFGI